MHRVRFLWKVFIGTLVVIVATGFVLEVFFVSSIEKRMRMQFERRLHEQTVLVRELVRECLPGAGAAGDALRVAPLERAAHELGGGRLTVCDVEGNVLFDSHQDATLMANQLARPELRKPELPVERAEQDGEATRTFLALPVREGEEIVAWARVGLSGRDLHARIDEVHSVVRVGIGVAAAVGVLLAYLFARRVSQPVAQIASLVSDARAGGRRSWAVDELDDLAGAVRTMVNELETRLEDIRRDREERDAMLSAMTEGLIAVDRQERVRFANAAARKLLGLGDDHENVPVRELTRIPEVGEAISRCLRLRENVRSEARVVGVEGEQVFELGAAPLVEEGGRVRGCVLVVHDISELRRLEAVRRDFVANVSHELKTPLTSVRGFLETVLEEPDMEPQGRAGFLRRAFANTERLQAIVSDLLSLARLESAEATLTFQSVDLNALTEQVVETARSHAERRKVSLALDGGSARLRVQGDRQALGTAIANLIDNAIKYSPAGGVVRVSLAGDGGRTLVRVADDGPGIPLAVQDRIFERFYRVDKDRSRELGGTGLGLSIVRHVVLAHRGRVRVDSAPGRGSTFVIELAREA